MRSPTISRLGSNASRKHSKLWITRRSQTNLMAITKRLSTIIWRARTKYRGTFRTALSSCFKLSSNLRQSSTSLKTDVKVSLRWKRRRDLLGSRLASLILRRGKDRRYLTYRKWATQRIWVINLTKLMEVQVAIWPKLSKHHQS